MKQISYILDIILKKKNLKKKCPENRFFSISVEAVSNHIYPNNIPTLMNLKVLLLWHVNDNSQTSFAIEMSSDFDMLHKMHRSNRQRTYQ